MADFIIEVLSREQIRSVYPLVREAVPTLDLSTWLRFARQLTGPRRGGQCGIVGGAARGQGISMRAVLLSRGIRPEAGQGVDRGPFRRRGPARSGSCSCGPGRGAGRVWQSVWGVRRCAAWCMAALPSRGGLYAAGTGRKARRCC